METTGIESLRRSLAMLPAQAPGLRREEAMRLLAELQEADQRIQKLREGLLSLVEMAGGEGER